MPFGRYAEKSVQAMSGLFNSGAMNRAAFKVGSVGRKGMAELGDLENIIASGRRRMAAGAGISAAGMVTNRSSGTRGLQTRSSAPQPGMPPFPM